MKLLFYFENRSSFSSIYYISFYYNSVKFCFKELRKLYPDPKILIKLLKKLSIVLL